MKLFSELIDLAGPSRAPKILCYFDNMQKENRLVINAACEYTPLQDWGPWVKGELRAPHLLRKLIKYSPDAIHGKSFTRHVFIKHNKKSLRVDLSTGAFAGTFKNTKFAEGEHTIRGFKVFNHHSTSETLILNRRTTITIPDIGKIILTTHNRGVNINLDDDVQKSLAPANARGALVSELCAKEIPKLSTSLPLQKGQDEIDYANKILEDRWLKDLNEFEKWKGNNPQQNTPEYWVQLGDGKGGKRKIPTEKPEKVKW